MVNSREPLIVEHPDGRGIAYESGPVGKSDVEFEANFDSRGSTVVGGSNEEFGTGTTGGPLFPPILQLSDLKARSRRSTIQPAFRLLPNKITVDKLVPFLSVQETMKMQEQAAKKLAELSPVAEHRARIANSSQAMEGLTRLLFVEDPCSHYAAIAFGNLAAFEDNLQSLGKFPDTLIGLVRMLFRYDDPLARKGAATALANMSLWQAGRKMIVDTSDSIKGLVKLASVPQNSSSHPYCGQEEAKSALLALALSEENMVPDCPISLEALAGCFTSQESDPTRSRVMQVNAVYALESLSATTQSAKKIGKSSQFPLILALLVQVLRNRPPTSSTEPASGHGIAVRSMAARALMNLSRQEDCQRMVIEFPNALSALFMSLRTRDDRSASSLELQQYAAKAVGYLARAKESRRTIVDLGTDGLAGLLFEDDNPGGQECAAWALANLSEDPHDSQEEIAVKIAAGGKIVRGLARLLQLPTKPESGSLSRIVVQEESLRALANLTCPHTNQIQIARVPDVVRTLAAALLSRRCHQKLSRRSLEDAARALKNLTCAKENWRSAEVFDDALRALVDVVSTDNVEATQKARTYAARALGNFALAPSHHRAIVRSKHAMTGLVRMIFSRDSNGGGKVEAVWALANLAHGESSVKSTIASFPHAIRGLEELLSHRENFQVQSQAMRALADLQEVLLASSVSEISVARFSSDFRGDFVGLQEFRPFLQRSASRHGEASIW